MDPEIEARFRAMETRFAKAEQKAQDAADLALASNNKPGIDQLKEVVTEALAAQSRGESGAFQAGEITVHSSIDGIYIRLANAKGRRA